MFGRGKWIDRDKTISGWKPRRNKDTKTNRNVAGSCQKQLLRKSRSNLPEIIPGMSTNISDQQKN